MTPGSLDIQADLRPPRRGPAAHRLDPPASCRLGFYLYNTPDEVDRAVAAVAAIAPHRTRRRPDADPGLSATDAA
jgi:hypothetical protein